MCFAEGAVGGLVAVARSPLLRARERLGDGPVARWLIATAICFKAPYFWSIRPSFLRLEPGRVEVWVPKRRAVTNHIGTVHAIAMCNAAELAGGSCVEMSIAPHLRWIPVGMEVEYQKLAQTSLKAVAVIDPDALVEPGDVGVPVTLTDTRGQQVFVARIRMRLSERRRGEGRHVGG